MAVRRRTAAAIRDVVVPKLATKLARSLDAYFAESLQRLEPDLAAAMAPIVRASTKAGTGLVDECEVAISTIGWRQEERELYRVVKPAAIVAGEEAVSAVGTELGVSASFDLSARPVQDVLSATATEIRLVTESSRRKIAREIAEGIEKGLSVEQIVKGVAPGTTNVRGPVPAFRGIRGLVDSWRSTQTRPIPGILGPVVRGVPLYSTRSYLIALTETGNAFNRSSMVGYAGAGVELVEVFDGPDCGWSQHNDPELAHGSIRKLADASKRPLSHPRCQRAFGASFADGPRSSPYQGRDRSDVPGATPGLRPDDLQPFNGRRVPTAPPASNLVVPRPAPVPGPQLRTLEEVLEEQGNRIRTLSTPEVGIAVDDAGNVILDKLGSGPGASGLRQTAGSVEFTAEELARLRGQTLIHNHPGAYQEGWAISSSFSPDDILLAAIHGIREMRVVGKGVDYVARVPAGTNPYLLKSLVDVAERKVRAETFDWIAKEKAKARAAASSGGGHFDMRAYAEAEKAIMGEANAQHFHRIWEIVSSQVPGFYYRRTLRPGVG